MVSLMKHGSDQNVSKYLSPWLAYFLPRVLIQTKSLASIPSTLQRFNAKNGRGLWDTNGYQKPIPISSLAHDRTVGRAGCGSMRGSWYNMQLACKIQSGIHIRLWFVYTSVNQAIHTLRINRTFAKDTSYIQLLLLMVEILHQMIGSLSHTNWT